MTPHYQSPSHLREFTDAVELAIRGVPQRVVVHAPPRHGKTETVLHSISYGLTANPRLTFGYASYNSDIALSKSRIARDLAVEKAGISLKRNSLREWRTNSGGGCMATGVGGGLTGYGINIGFVDDSIKDRVEAESPRRRERIDDWFRDVFMTRIEPGGSVFCFQTRWHPDDLPGRLIKKGWRYICLPAIREDSQPLWPERWSLEDLLARKADVGQYSWESLYQGQPRPRGGAVFGQPYGYQKAPRLYRVGIGIDLAYAAKSSSDWSVIVVLAQELKPGGGTTGQLYVIDCVHVQVRSPQFLAMCKLVAKQYPTAPWRWYAAGVEQGAADFLIDGGIPLQVLTPRGDKFVRSIPYAAAWNAGKIAVPGGSVWGDGEDEEVETAPVPPEWLHPMLSEHSDFTGVNDAHDDIVDAAVAAYDVLNEGADASFPSSKLPSSSPRSL